MSGVLMWVVWALIGFIAGYMAGRLLPRVSMWLLVILGIAGGMVGGWALPAIIGTADQATNGSLLTSLAGAALMVWIGTLISRRFMPADDDNDNA